MPPAFFPSWCFILVSWLSDWQMILFIFLCQVMKMDFPRVLGCFSSRCSSLSFTSSRANRVGVVPDHRWRGFHVACLKTQWSDCGRRIPGLSVLSVSSLLPAVAVQVVPAFRDGKDSRLSPASHFFANGTGIQNATQGFLLNENQICWVLAGAEGGLWPNGPNSVIPKFFTWKLGNPNELMVTGGRNHFCLDEGSESECWSLSAGTKRAHCWRSPWHRSSLLFLSFRNEQSVIPSHKRLKIVEPLSWEQKNHSFPFL